MSVIEKEVKLQKPTQETLDLYHLRRTNSMGIVHNYLVKNLPKGVITQAAKQLGLYYKKSIAVEADQALDVLFNHAIFHYLHNGKQLIERFTSEAIIAKKMSEEKLEMLRVLQKASYGILSVLETHPLGGVYVEDCLNDKTFLLMDEGLSFSAKKGLMVATTYLTFPEFSMTTGAALPVIYYIDKLDVLIDEFDIEYRPFFELPLKQQTKFITQLTKHCLEQGVLNHIGFVKQQPVF